MTGPAQDSPQDLAAAYALGALSADEARRFETFLATSPEAQREVPEYREVAALLALAGPEAEPRSTADLRERVLARVAEEAPVPAGRPACGHQPGRRRPCGVAPARGPASRGEHRARSSGLVSAHGAGWRRLRRPTRGDRPRRLARPPAAARASARQLSTRSSSRASSFPAHRQRRPRARHPALLESQRNHGHRPRLPAQAGPCRTRRISCGSSRMACRSLGHVQARAHRPCEGREDSGSGGRSAERRGDHRRTRRRLSTADVNPDPGGSTPEVLTVKHPLPTRALLNARALLTARVFLFLATSAAPLRAQAEDAVAQERAAFKEWLETAPTSPLAVIARQPIGAGLTLGPAMADISLPGVAEHRIRETEGHVALQGPEGARTISRGALVRVGRYALTVDGIPGRAVVTAFGPSRKPYIADYYPFTADWIFTGRLIPPSPRGTVQVLGLDGIEVEAVEAGSVMVPMGDRTTRLRVRRLPTGGEESELEIFFRDSTNGNGTYPAGRFVPLIPAGPGRYRLDFNRARNPFCAYNSTYPCPAPWAGNVLPAPVTAGERYRVAGSGQGWRSERRGDPRLGVGLGGHSLLLRGLGVPR